MENLILAFCSVTPEHYEDEINAYRIKEYTISLKQLQRVKPDNFDILIFDNTPYSVDREGFIHVSKNEGVINKGLGELAMLKYAADNYEFTGKVCYITGRHFFTCPYFFDKVNKMKSEALVSNPDFYYLDGNIIESCKVNMYNDMAFAMRAQKMKEYANYIDFHKSIDKNIGSEHWLFDFIVKNGIRCEWLDFLGLIRNDWYKAGYALESYHVC